METHRFDVLSFSFGLIYAVIGLLFLLPATPVGLIDAVLGTSRWLWPALILGLGMAIVVPLVRSASRPEGSADTETESE